MSSRLALYSGIILESTVRGTGDAQHCFDPRDTRVESRGSAAPVNPWSRLFACPVRRAHGICPSVCLLSKQYSLSRWANSFVSRVFLALSLSDADVCPFLLRTALRESSGYLITRSGGQYRAVYTERGRERARLAFTSARARFRPAPKRIPSALTVRSSCCSACAFAKSA